MCTVVILRRPEAAWPVLFASNRDEMAGRPWTPPGHHWPDRPEVVAGRDELAGGSWLGVNRSGVIAAILNRHGTLGPVPGLRSRGELVLEALDHVDAKDAAKALGALEPASFRAFNMVIADNRDAFWVRSLGSAPTNCGIKVAPIPTGLSMITAHELNDESSARIRFYRPRFAAAPVPDPESNDWSAWETLLASQEGEPDAGPHGGLTIVTQEEGGKRSGYGTLSASLIALAAPGHAPPGIVWRFAPGPADITPFQDVKI
jgi:hypothetical protein